jgi:hypothetical protein
MVCYCLDLYCILTKIECLDSGNANNLKLNYREMDKITTIKKWLVFQLQSPKNKCPSNYLHTRSPDELMAAFDPNPQLTATTTVSGLNSLRPNSGAGSRTGTDDWSRFGPLPKMP